MNKLSKYFSLFKYSLSNPKNGLNLLNEARQSRYNTQSIQKHQTRPLSLEECLKIFFPNMTEESFEDIFFDSTSVLSG